jgi:spore germination cell wall hydrolase CwlJ-like protein
MVASHKRPKGFRKCGPFGLSVLAMILVPRQAGYQDLVALMAQQTEVPQRARAHLLASPFGTIHAATFSFPQPIGTEIPEPPVQLASVAADPATTGSLGRNPYGAPLSLYRPRLDFPAVNRRLKGDLLVTRPRYDGPLPAESTHDLTPGRVKTVLFTRPVVAPPEVPAVLPTAHADPAADSAASQRKTDVVSASLSPSLTPAPKPSAAPEPGELTAADLALKPDPPAPASAAELGGSAKAAPHSYELAALAPAQRVEQAPLAETLDDTNPAVRLGRLYFGNSATGEGIGAIQPWPADEELLIETPAHDPDIKRSAVPSPSSPDFNFETPSATPVPAAPTPAPESAGQTVATKGQVTGADRRPKTPAERLGLNAKQRARAEKCLADAVYFESRGEPKRGQIAVAQVVMNRVFSGFYPTNVCGVVYQNANRKLACQFTFACDGIPDVVTEPDMWKQAKDIARDMLDGKLWLPEIGHSTHYHAYWVHPSWVNEMKKLYKIGVHSFYRPRAWGDGSDIPPFNASQAQTPSSADATKKAKL